MSSSPHQTLSNNNMIHNNHQQQSIIKRHHQLQSEGDDDQGIITNNNNNTNKTLNDIINNNKKRNPSSLLPPISPATPSSPIYNDYSSSAGGSDLNTSRTFSSSSNLDESSSFSESNSLLYSLSRCRSRCASMFLRPSLRLVIGVFFFVLVAVAWSVPIAVTFQAAEKTIDQSVTTLGSETSILIRKKLERQLAIGSGTFSSIVNWTVSQGAMPYDNAQSRRNFFTQFTKSVLLTQYSQWSTIFFRFIDGTGAISLETAPELQHVQMCISNDSYYGAGYPNPRPLYSNEQDCEVLVINTTTREALDPAEYPDEYAFRIQLSGPTFVQGLWWNTTSAVVAGYEEQGLLNGNESLYSYDPFYARRDSIDDQVADAMMYLVTRMIGGDASMHGGSKIDYVAFATVALFAGDLGSVLLANLPPAPAARAYLTSERSVENNRVLATSHGEVTVQYFFNSSEEFNNGLSENCFGASTLLRMFCFYNLSEHPDYFLLRGEYKPTEYIDSQLQLDFLGSVATLNVFLPVDFYTEPLQSATKTTIAIIIVLVVLGTVAVFVGLSVALRRVEELATEMSQNPFERSKKLKQQKREEQKREEKKNEASLLKNNNTKQQEVKMMNEDDVNSSGSGSTNPNNRKNNSDNNKNKSVSCVCSDQQKFFQFEELMEIEAGFAEFSDVIESLSCFMPDTTMMVRESRNAMLLAKRDGQQSSGNNIIENNNTLENDDDEDAVVDSMSPSSNNITSSKKGASSVMISINGTKPTQGVLKNSTTNNNNNNNTDNGAVVCKDLMSQSNNNNNPQSIPNNASSATDDDNINSSSTREDNSAAHKKHQQKHQGRKLKKKVTFGFVEEGSASSSSRNPTDSSNRTNNNNGSTNSGRLGVTAARPSDIAEFAAETSINNNNSNNNSDRSSPTPTSESTRVSNDLSSNDDSSSPEHNTNNTNNNNNDNNAQTSSAATTTSTIIGSASASGHSSRSGVPTTPTRQHIAKNDTNVVVNAKEDNNENNNNNLKEIDDIFSESSADDTTDQDESDYQQQQQQQSPRHKAYRRNNNEVTRGDGSPAAVSSTINNTDPASPSSMVVGKNKNKNISRYSKCLLACVHFFGPATASASSSGAGTAANQTFSPDGHTFPSDKRSDSEEEIIKSRGFLSEDQYKQQLLDRADLIVSTMMTDVVEATGARLIEYRNDTFIICLRITRRPKSRLATRFLHRLVIAADKIAESPLQQPFNQGPQNSMCMSAALTVEDRAFILNLEADSSTTISRPVTIFSPFVQLTHSFEMVSRSVVTATDDLGLHTFSMNDIYGGVNNSTMNSATKSERGEKQQQQPPIQKGGQTMQSKKKHKVKELDDEVTSSDTTTDENGNGNINGSNIKAGEDDFNMDENNNLINVKEGGQEASMNLEEGFQNNNTQNITYSIVAPFEHANVFFSRLGSHEQQQQPHQPEQEQSQQPSSENPQGEIGNNNDLMAVVVPQQLKEKQYFYRTFLDLHFETIFKCHSKYFKQQQREQHRNNENDDDDNNDDGSNKSGNMRNRSKNGRQKMEYKYEPLTLPPPPLTLSTIVNVEKFDLVNCFVSTE